MKKEMARIKEENEILKKAMAILQCKKLELVVPIIEKYKDEHGVSKMCKVLGIARSSFYKALNKSELPRAKENDELKLAIHKIYHENKGRYGSPKVHQIMM